MHVLRWHLNSVELAPHELRAVEQYGRTKLHLLVKKNGGNNPQSLVLSVDCYPAVIADAWKAQGENWIETSKVQSGTRYFAIRFIRLGAQDFIVWRVEHIDGMPYDLLDFFSGTQAEMEAFFSQNAN